MKRVILILLFACFSWANSTQDLLINKFTKVYHQLAEGDAARVGVALRLADLLSERARLASFEELQKNCTICNAGQEDRKLAIKYYNEVIDKVEPAKLPAVLAHIGHLYELVGEEKKAISLYKKIVATTPSEESKAEAYLSLAEVHFKKRKFIAAKEYYEQALKLPSLKKKSLATYRSAWCLFHLGEVNSAKAILAQMLKKPELLQRNASGFSSQGDLGFHSEVAKDYAIFISKSITDESEIYDLFKLSPVESALENSVYLAQELENQGNKVLAKTAWEFALQKITKTEEKLRAQLHISQLELESGDKIAASKRIESAFLTWSSISQCGEECEKLKKRLRKFVLDWNRTEKKTMSPELEQVYSLYVKKFPEADMKLWLAQNLEHAKRFFDARVFLLQAIADFENGQKLPEGVKTVESLWIKQMELAELSKDKALHLQSLKLYVDRSKQKTKIDEARYQIAYMKYENKNYQEAATEFYSIVTDKGVKNLKIKKQAADLALDTAVLLKNENLLAQWARDFQVQLPKFKNEFNGVLRKTRMNQVAKLTQSGDKELLSSWNILLTTPMDNASKEEELTYYRNKLILAEKLNKSLEVTSAAQKILELPNASATDREFALSRLAWQAEMKLDFVQAYNFSKKLKMESLGAQEKKLKLALLADLSGNKNNQHYRNYLKTAKVDDRSFLVAMKILKNSKKPTNELKQYKKFLLHKKNLLAESILNIYLQTNNKKVLTWLKGEKELKDTSVAKLFWRADFLDSYVKREAKLKNVDLSKATERNLNRLLVKKIKVLDQFESYTNKTIASGDWTAQLLCLNTLAQENMGFYNFLLSAPMPQGLNEAEQQEYLTAISQKATPYMLKAEQYRKKVEEFWQNSQAIALLKDQYLNANQELRSILQKELNALLVIAPETNKVELQNISMLPVKQKSMPSLQEIQAAKLAVQKNPNDLVAIDTLIGIQEKLGQESMVEYLRIRKQRIDGGKL